MVSPLTILGLGAIRWVCLISDSRQLYHPTWYFYHLSYYGINDILQELDERKNERIIEMLWETEIFLSGEDCVCQLDVLADLILSISNLRRDNR